MTPLFDPDDLAERPAPRVLALAWVAAAAQTSVAAWAWGACLVIGLLAHRWRTRADEAGSPSKALNELQPRPARAPARRRTDATRSAGHKAQSAAPQLKAHCDALTGLASPEYMNDTAAALTQDLQMRGLALCVLRIGLNGLDDVVSLYGRDAGNQVLVQAAKRLRHLKREEDILVRASGAGFVLLLSCPPQDTREFARALATRVITELQRPLAYRTVSNLHIGCSVGSAAWPLNGSTLDEVMHRAEEAFTLARPGSHGQTSHYAGQGAGQSPAIAA